MYICDFCGTVKVYTRKPKKFNDANKKLYINVYYDDYIEWCGLCYNESHIDDNVNNFSFYTYLRPQTVQAIFYFVCANYCVNFYSTSYVYSIMSMYIDAINNKIIKLNAKCNLNV